MPAPQTSPTQQRAAELRKRLRQEQAKAQYDQLFAAAFDRDSALAAEVLNDMCVELGLFVDELVPFTHQDLEDIQFREENFELLVNGGVAIDPHVDPVLRWRAAEAVKNTLINDKERADSDALERHQRHLAIATDGEESAEAWFEDGLILGRFDLLVELLSCDKSLTSAERLARDLQLAKLADEIPSPISFFEVNLDPSNIKLGDAFFFAVVERYGKGVAYRLVTDPPEIMNEHPIDVLCELNPPDELPGAVDRFCGETDPVAIAIAYSNGYGGSSLAASSCVISSKVLGDIDTIPEGIFHTPRA